MTIHQAKIILLEQALSQAVYTIDFLDNCLCNPNEYLCGYPDQTQTHLIEFKKLLPQSVPICTHSYTDKNCESCKHRLILDINKEEALEVLKNQRT